PMKPEGTITMRHLLNHSAGIEGYASKSEQENMVKYPTLADALAVFKDRPLRSSPGTEFHYTTYGYVVLGAIIEAVSGQNYGDYMQRHIWDKAGMEDTGIERMDSNMPERSRL